MKPSQTTLAETIDEWTSLGRCHVSENDVFLAVSGLNATDATAMRLACKSMGWPVQVEDLTPEVIDDDQLSASSEPYKVTATKPKAPVDARQIVTSAGFEAWLERVPDDVQCLYLAHLTKAFETYSLRFAPWEDRAKFDSILIDSDPRKFVREAGSVRTVAGNLGPWLLRRVDEIDWNDKVVRVWARKAAETIGRALADELEADGVIMFRGPPIVRYSSQNLKAESLSVTEFAALQNAADWVFRSGSECETRHGLLAAEFARTNVASSDIVELFRHGAAPALEGAKIAHQLGLQKLSSDTLKAISDLRKAVVDEATKLTDTTRQLATSVTGAVFVGIGLIATRLNMTTGNLAISRAIASMGVILFFYVLVVANSGRQFMLIQRELRELWRDKLYRFLPPDEYKTMVAAPTQKAERSFINGARVSVLLAFLLMVVIVAIAFYGPIAGTPPQAQVVPTSPQQSQTNPSPPQPQPQPQPQPAQPLPARQPPASH